jgi:hypothetical protein
MGVLIENSCINERCFIAMFDSERQRVDTISTFKHSERQRVDTISTTNEGHISSSVRMSDSE